MAEEGGSNQGELRIKLVIDDGTSETLNKVKEDLGGIHAKAEETGHAIEGLFQLEKLRTGFEIAKGIFESVAETIHAGYEIAERFGEAASEAATEAQKQERAMSGTLFLLDQGAHSLEAVKDYAGEVREELEKGGLAAGVSVGQMTDMFTTIVERGHMSSEAAKDLTEQMATVGKITRGGMQSLADGFAMMELGVIRARNPLVQLIASTGLLHGNAKMVATQLQKMTPADQMKLAEEAVRKQAEGMKKGGGMALTLDEVRTSLSGYREMFFESMGRPMLDKLLPALTEVQHWLAENSDAMKEYADWIGHGLGDFISGIRQAVLGIYDGIASNWKQVSSTFHMLFDNWKDAWDYSVGKSGDIRTMFKGMTDGLLHAFEQVMKYVKAAGEVAMDIKDAYNKLDTALLNIVTKKGAGKSADSIHVGDTQVAMQAKALAKLQSEGTDAQFQAAAEKLRKLAQDVYQGMIPDNAAYKRYTDLIEKATEVREAEDRAVEGLKSNIESQDVDKIGEQLRAKQKEQDAAYMVTAAQFFLNSDVMALALESGKINVEGGFDSFIKMVDEKSPEVAEKLKKMLAGLHGAKIEDIAGKGGINFHIGNVTIHQDFRDQDPDRVVIAFRKDFARQSAARVQSRLSTPFGL